MFASFLRNAKINAIHPSINPSISIFWIIYILWLLFYLIDP